MVDVGTARLLRAAITLLITAVIATLSCAVGVAEPTSAVPTAPGTVVDVRELPRDEWVSGAKKSLLITYWSVDANGSPMQSTGSLFIPEGKPPPGGWPILARAHGTAGIGDQCAPTNTGLGQQVRDYIGTWNREGYVVVATDYAGLGTPGVHPYLDGAAAAHSIVDSVRAARAIYPRLSMSWAAIGVSQGGHASLFSAHLARTIAPELDFRGAVAMAPPSNLENLFPLIGPHVPRLPIKGTLTYLGYILASLRSSHPELNVNSYLSPFGINVVNQLEQLCAGDAQEKLGNAAIGDLFARPLFGSPLNAALRQMLAVPTSGYDRPILLAQGLADEIVPPPLTAKLAADLIANGVDVTVLVYRGNHLDVFFDTLPDAIRFVRTIFA